ncbi:hypothetical protein OQA88_9091 [Cercophora sp. LCS_1]
MRFLRILTLASSVSAGSLGSGGPGGTKCLKQRHVDTLVEAYKSILTQWEPSMADILADDGFFDYSDSINTVAGLATGFPIFPNKTDFIAHQTDAVRLFASMFSTGPTIPSIGTNSRVQPDSLPLSIVEVGPWNCGQITVIWSATFTGVPGGTPLPVRGITVIEAKYSRKEDQFQIQSLKVEFNSMNFYRNIGGVCERPAPPP